VPPQSIGGAYYRTGMTIFLTIITLGIWAILWSYRTNEDLKRYNGDGLGGVLGVVIYILLSIVLMFTIPSEIQKMYQRDGRQSPVSPIWGLWFLLPLIGNIIWYVKVQRSLNDFWLSKGSRPG
jgi:Ca2+/Na+ antiporter